MKKAIAALVALLLATGTYLLGVMPARADVAAHWDGRGTSGHEITVKFADGSTKRVGTFLFDLKVGDAWLTAYCIQIDVSTSSPVDYTEGDFDQVQQHAKVLWAMLHGYPNVTLGQLAAAADVSGTLGERDAITGTQAAIWRFSDGAVPTSGLNGNAQKVYDYLTGSANTGVTTPPRPSLSLDPHSAEGDVGDRLGPFTLRMSGSAEATLTAPGATITNAAGAVIDKASDGDRIYLTRTSAGSSTLTAAAATTVEAGRSFLAVKNGKKQQTLILAQSATASSSDSVTASWQKTTTIDQIAAPTFVDGTCTVANDIVTPKVSGISWQVTGTAGWGTTVTVTAVALPGHVIKPGVTTQWQHTFPAEPDCRTTVTPVAPQVSWEICAAPGQPGKIVITPATTTGIRYEVEGRTVTATARSGYRIGAAPGWTVSANGRTATYEVTAQNPDDCIATATPVEPTVTHSATCDVQGSYRIPNTAGVTYLLDGTVIAPGTYSGPVSGALTATAKPGYRLADPNWSYALQIAAADTCVAPVAPAVGWAQCLAAGQPGEIVITPATTEGIRYEVEGRTVTAIALPGYRLVAAEGWQLAADGRTATLAVTATNPDDCIVTVDPVEPTVTQSDRCEVEGTLAIPETVGVEYLLDGQPVSGTLTGPLAGTVTARALAGYALRDAQWSVVVDLPAAQECGTPTPTPTEGGSGTPTPTPTESGSGTPTPSPTDNGGTLPHTGSDAVALALTGLLVVGAGAALVIATVRRPRGRRI